MVELRNALAQIGRLTHRDRSPAERTQLQQALKDLRAVLERLAPDHRTRHGEGQVIPADIPWVIVFPSDEAAPDPKRGYYVVYLFAEDGSYVNLSLGVGTVSAGNLGAITARARALREQTGQPEQESNVEPVLGSAKARAAHYIAGTAQAKPYSASSLPSEDVLAADFLNLVARMDEAFGAGLRFAAGPEPMHLFVPWVEEVGGPGIVRARKAIAEEHGAAWWVSNRPIAPDKVTALNNQVSSGVPTYAYLYANGDSWRTQLRAVTADQRVVLQEPELLATGYELVDGRMALKLRNFQAMPNTWSGQGLLGMRGGSPIEESVAGRPAFTYVYSGRAVDHMPSVEGKDDVLTPSPLPPPAPAPDITKQLSALASESGLDVTFLREIYDVLQSDLPQAILAGPPGTGKTWLAKKLANVGHEGPHPSYDLVQFHPSYAYEDFIEGLRPVAKDNQVTFVNEDGHLLRLVRDLPNGPRTLVIDELNRANIPSVFGELLYLLEYRNESVKLRLSGDFRLPPEVRFVATMNTADRSIRSVDAALRRRFEIFELMPSAAALANYYRTTGQLSVPNLVAGFELLNARLEAAIDRHHGIGHSFFMQAHLTRETLQAIWDRKVRPLIEEYFFDEPQRVDNEFTFPDLWPLQVT